MATIHENIDEVFEDRIGLPEGKEWSAGHRAAIKAFVKKEAQKRSPEERLDIKLTGLRYRMENYLDNSEITIKEIRSIEVFLAEFLKILNLSFKKFAVSIDTTDGNLKKYLLGERKFNTDLAMKFGSFFHTTPDLWLSISTKNELLLLKKEKEHINKYKKYDYKNVVQLKSAS